MWECQPLDDSATSKCPRAATGRHPRDPRAPPRVPAERAACGSRSSRSPTAAGASSRPAARPRTARPATRPRPRWTTTRATSSTCSISLHVDDAVIGGLSMGGYVTFAIFRHAPAYFRGMVLADTRPQADTAGGDRRAARGCSRSFARRARRGRRRDDAEAARRDHAPDAARRWSNASERVILANPPEAIAGAITATDDPARFDAAAVDDPLSDADRRRRGRHVDAARAEPGHAARRFRVPSS